LVKQRQKRIVRFGLLRSRANIFIAHSVHIELGGLREATRKIKPGKVSVAEVHRRREHSINEISVPSDFHALESRRFLKLYPLSFEIAGDVCPLEVHWRIVH